MFKNNNKMTICMRIGFYYNRTEVKYFNQIYKLNFHVITHF